MKPVHVFSCSLMSFALPLFVSADTPPAPANLFTHPVELKELDEIRGLSGILDITNIANLEAVLADNDASNSVTGNNVIDGSSFNEASGVFSIIQNTGNNVIIQDSTIITVTIHPD
ncbi:hypothetical protein [Salinimonas chungwhensis]|uniref:hypothetical protein n=1 Tax=Salinimonas chungwhensis TaxID=265425 RepID=UPI000376A5B6|nr:hypothetical protein [Salinimonas chungwhensis]